MKHSLTKSPLYFEDVHLEWDSTARANNVTKLTKKMEISGSTFIGYFLYGSEWCFDFNVNISYTFSIIEGKNLLLVRLDEMIASDNQFMKTDGLLFVFNSEKEITDFINTIAIYRVNDFKNKQKTEDIFK